MSKTVALFLFTKCLRLSEAIHHKKNEEITLRLRRRADGVYDILGEKP